MRTFINICFDLDGPVIDVSGRYYHAYLESLHGADITKEQILSKEEFWKYKQNRVSDTEIGILSSLTYKEAKNSAEVRRKHTFSSSYLSFDCLFNDVVDTFNKLKSGKVNFFVATLRKEDHLMHAVKQFKLDKFLQPDHLFCVSNETQIKNDVEEKYNLLFNAVNKLHLNPQNTWIIGDSDTDIHAGRLAKYKKVIVIPRGVRSKQQLEILKPDLIINSLVEIIELLKKDDW